MTEYYILSLKWTRSREENITWWGPRNSGYVIALEQAGRYTEDDIKQAPSYYDNRTDTLAVLCEIAEQYAKRIVGYDPARVQALLQGALG